MSSAWLKLHAAGEKKLAKVVGKYFKGQAARVIARLDSFGILTDKLATHLIDVAAETKLLQHAVATPIIGFMGTGAENVLNQARKPKSTKAFDSEALKDVELPQWVKGEIESAFADLEEQDYWQEIQKATVESVADAVKQAIDEGMSMSKAAKFLEDNFAFSSTRAAAIARTETTGAFNAGHDASYHFLHQTGDITGVEWLAVLDKDTRESHADANGQIIKVGEMFDVGGETAQYPGDPSLSAAERVNCRCTTSGVFGE
jgi:SPP1 gp7 family putative phage head morphogenesis protein